VQKNAVCDGTISNESRNSREASYYGGITYQEIDTIVAFNVEGPPDHVPAHVRRNTPHVAAEESERGQTCGVAFLELGILLRKIVETVLDSAGEAEWYTPSGALGEF
jgi:hypothetical protein